VALKDMLRRVSPGQNDDCAEAAELCESGSGVTTKLSDLVPRQSATVSGHIESMRVVPARDGSTWLEATVQDGTGTLIVLWTGRKRIPGVRPGARLLVTGRPLPAVTTGRPTIYNPSYELIA
jgi:hypothetical protein